MVRKVLTAVAALFLVVGFAYGANKKFTLVIDAGHGGHDTGALGSFSKEKNINLKVALAFGKYVESNCPDVSVIYTRKTDVFIPLQDRADIANKNGADLFMSIHTNALAGGKIARGFETYTLGMHRFNENLDVAMRENSVISMEKDYENSYQGFDPNSSESYIMFEFMQTANMEKSVELAKMVQKSVCKTAGRANKGVHQAGFLVLRQTSMPSCLIELGFITTSDEEEFLNTDDGVDAMACGIYNAFAEYKNKYSDKIVVPYAAPKNPGISVGRVIPQNTDNKQQDSAEKQNNSGKNQNESAKKQNNSGKNQNESAKKQNESAKKQNESAKKQSEPDKKQNESVKQQSIPATKLTPASKSSVTSAPAAKDDNKADVSDTAGDKPVFKVQIFVTNKVLAQNNSLLKGHTEASYYKDGSSVKYTIGASCNYNEIVSLRKTLLKDFPEAFIVAFKNDTRMDINKAIAEFKKAQ